VAAGKTSHKIPSQSLAWLASAELYAVAHWHLANLSGTLTSVLSFSMRRFLLPALGSVLVLLSCTSKRDLSSADVLHRAALASQNLDSARFAVNGGLTYTVDDSKIEANGVLEGVLQDGGRQTKTTVHINGKMQDQASSAQNMTVKGEVIITSPTEIFLKFETLLIDPIAAHPPEKLSSLTGKWWKLPSSGSNALGQTMTPDPSLLQAQAEVVIIKSEEPMEQINGREAYHYRVTLDKTKLIAYLRRVAEEQKEDFDEERMQSVLQNFDAEGELWIDAEHFYLHRIEWKILPALGQDPAAFSLLFTIDLRDHGNAPPVSPPADAEPFSPAAFPWNAPVFPSFDLKLFSVPPSGSVSPQ